MRKSGKVSNRKKNTRKTRKKFLVYAVELSALAAFLGVAFFMPQIIFHVQDHVLWGKTMLSERERVDVESLGTAYEKSLAVRMQNYAEGLAAEDTFYVNEESFLVGEEIYDYLEQDFQLLNQEIIGVLLEGGLIPYSFYKMGYTVNQWKQYVIYSDNYTKGVNFILWYVELQDVNGVLLRLLLDAETDTIYALKTENNIPFDKGKEYENYDYLRKYWRNGNMAYELWCYFALYYESITEKELSGYMDEEQMWGENAVISEAAETSGNVNAAGNEEAFGRKDVTYHLDEEDTMRYRLPYGEAYLDVLMKVEDTDQDLKYIFIYPNVTIGVRQIYEMIPEFA